MLFYKTVNHDNNVEKHYHERRESNVHKLRVNNKTIDSIHI